MITSRLLVIAVLALMAYAAAQTLVYTDIQTNVELARHVESAPAVLDYGRIDLGIPAIMSTVHVKPNGESSLWASVIDGPGGWTLGPQVGPDTYAVLVNDIPMSAEPVQVHPTASPYVESAITFFYYAPTSDSIGAGVNQGYRLRIEAREPDPNYDPGVPAPGGD